jgi:hypothetical protein
MSEEYRRSTLQGLFETLARESENSEWYELDPMITIGKDSEEDEWVAVIDFVDDKDDDDELEFEREEWRDGFHALHEEDEDDRIAD